jgi:SAM-dependent methyltransferase
MQGASRFMLAAMSERLRGLYEERDYPAMSHPPSHPAVTGVLARLAGLPPVDPADMRVLELGCAGGWNLLPIAAEFPGARCVGVDFSERAVADARQVADEAGLGNVRFEMADLASWQSEGPGHDFIIAHGVFSWVPDAVKLRLLELCRDALAPGGVAYVGFNTDPGWALRKPVAETVRALVGRSGFGDSPEPVLEGIFEALEGAGGAYPDALRAVVQDMRAKAEMLEFDDLAPVCDPVTVAQFVGWAAEAGLAWLGEAELAQTLPDGVSTSGERWLAHAGPDRLLAEQLADLLSGRTHRAAVLARADVARPERVSSRVVLDLCVRSGLGVAEREGTMELIDRGGGVRARVKERLSRACFGALAELAPACVPVIEMLEAAGRRLGGLDLSNELPAISRMLLDAAKAGLLELRTEPVRISRELPPKPELDTLRRVAVRRKRPLVDAFHAPCSFPEPHYRVLAAIDGTRSTDELAAMARAHTPELDFPRWIEHLARRGLIR